MAETKILLALQARLDELVVEYDLGPALPIVMPRQHYRPTAGDAFLRAWHLPADTRELCVGSDAPAHYRGVFQIDVMWPDANDGLVGPVTVAEAVCAHFAKGTTLTRDDVTVRVTTRPSIGPTFEDGGWSKTPVSIYYLAFA